MHNIVKTTTTTTTNITVLLITTDINKQTKSGGLILSFGKRISWQVRRIYDRIEYKQTEYATIPFYEVLWWRELTNRTHSLLEHSVDNQNFCTQKNVMVDLIHLMVNSCNLPWKVIWFSLFSYSKYILESKRRLFFY